MTCDQGDKQTRRRLRYSGGNGRPRERGSINPLNLSDSARVGLLQIRITPCMGSVLWEWRHAANKAPSTRSTFLIRPGAGLLQAHSFCGQLLRERRPAANKAPSTRSTFLFGPGRASYRSVLPRAWAECCGSGAPPRTNSGNPLNTAASAWAGLR